MKLRIAVAQFPITRDVESNVRYVERYVASAARQRADLILFPETALTGYAGVDFQTFSGFDWNELDSALERVQAAACEKRIWVVVGTHTRNRVRRKPFNSLYAIDKHGRVVDRYDKRILARSDQSFYEAGKRGTVVNLNKAHIGLLICHEWRYPELYRDYKRRKADIILQSWYDGALSLEAFQSDGAVMSEVIPAAAQGHAACNHLWVCGANTSQEYSCFGGFVIRPDGTFQVRQTRHRAGVTVTTIDTDSGHVDLAAHARARVMRGEF